MTEKSRKWMKNDIKIKYIPFPAATESVGIFNGFSVEVFNENDIKNLHMNSFYGTGSFSRSLPECLRERRGINCDLNSQEERGPSDPFIPKNTIPETEEPSLKKLKLFENNLTTAGSSVPVIKESLDLMLEEAFFLHHSLQCLKILNLESEEILTDHLWRDFCELKHNFLECFVAYLYLKGKNWVIKSGIKFGGDFGESLEVFSGDSLKLTRFLLLVLYKNSPQAYHAAYIVLVTCGQKVDPNIHKTIYRIAETTGKVSTIFNENSSSIQVSNVVFELF
jgi:tRNA-splicing endonuclease subunit Sen2